MHTIIEVTMNQSVWSVHVMQIGKHAERSFISKAEAFEYASLLGSSRLMLEEFYYDSINYYDVIESSVGPNIYVGFGLSYTNEL